VYQDQTGNLSTGCELSSAGCVCQLGGMSQDTRDNGTQCLHIWSIRNRASQCELRGDEKVLDGQSKTDRRSKTSGSIVQNVEISALPRLAHDEVKAALWEW
jgi:hypothetical protein